VSIDWAMQRASLKMKDYMDFLWVGLVVKAALVLEEFF